MCLLRRCSTLRPAPRSSLVATCRAVGVLGGSPEAVQRRGVVEGVGVVGASGWGRGVVGGWCWIAETGGLGRRRWEDGSGVLREEDFDGWGLEGGLVMGWMGEGMVVLGMDEGGYDRMRRWIWVRRTHYDGWIQCCCSYLAMDGF